MYSKTEVCFEKGQQASRTKTIPIAIQDFHCLLSASGKVAVQPFDITEWKTYFPSDLTQQNNNVDIFM